MLPREIIGNSRSNIDDWIIESLRLNSQKYESIASISIFDDKNPETVSFNLFYTMQSIAESIEKGALGSDNEIPFGGNFDGTFKYNAKFTTQRLGLTNAKTILMFEILSDGSYQERFRINVLPSPVDEYDIRNGNTYPGGPALDRYSLTARDNALLQHLAGILRLKSIKEDHNKID